jgi:copper homeostasis protein
MHPTAEEGTELLAKLVHKAGNRIVIMPGSGVRSSNLEKLIRHTQAKEYHSSAAVEQITEMAFKNKNFAPDDGTFLSVNAAEIFLQKEILNRNSESEF